MNNKSSLWWEKGEKRKGKYATLFLIIKFIIKLISDRCTAYLKLKK